MNEKPRRSSISTSTMKQVEDARPLTPAAGGRQELDAAAVVASWDATASVIKESMYFGRDLIRAMDEHKVLMKDHMKREARRSVTTRLFVVAAMLIHMTLLQAAVSRFEGEQKAQRDHLEQTLDAAP